MTTGGRTSDNVNLPTNFVDVMMATYGGTRIGRQELDGELIADVEGSLVAARLDRALPGRAAGRGSTASSWASIRRRGRGRGRTPAASSSCARAGEKFYVLADESVQGLSPDGWARAVAAAAARWEADRVVAEANNGGAMVAEVLRAADSGLAPKLVHASRGKVARAEPVALAVRGGAGVLRRGLSRPGRRADGAAGGRRL